MWLSSAELSMMNKKKTSLILLILLVLVMVMLCVAFMANRSKEQMKLNDTPEPENGCNTDSDIGLSVCLN